MAEAIMRHMIEEGGVESTFCVDSCGTGDYHRGEAPHRGTQAILNQHNISFKGIRAREISQHDIDTSDWIVAMDDSNIATIKSRYPLAVVHKITDFIAETKHTHVPDPYFDGNFNLTFDIVSQGCEGLMVAIDAV
jgi:protein-tyrosine phosphatase